MYEPGPSVLPAFWICLYLTQSHLHAQSKAEIAPGAILQCNRNVPSFHFHYVLFPKVSIKKHLISLCVRARCRGDGAAAVLCSLVEDVLFAALSILILASSPFGQTSLAQKQLLCRAAVWGNTSLMECLLAGRGCSQRAGCLLDNQCCCMAPT